MMEKDYVLGWLLFGFSNTKLIFKGRTALSKIFFPRIWRLSEDLDFSFDGKFDDIDLRSIFNLIEKGSKIKLRLKSKYQNPEYLQLKIQYQALLGKNWIKVDVTKEKVVEKPVVKTISKSYSDYPQFSIKVMHLDEVFAEKLRALVERKKSRDYYDIWKMLSLKTDKKKIRELFFKKCEIKQIEFKNMEQLFPKDLEEILRPYWERELSRLVSPIPDLTMVLNQLKNNLTCL